MTVFIHSNVKIDTIDAKVKRQEKHGLKPGSVVRCADYLITDFTVTRSVNIFFFKSVSAQTNFVLLAVGK